MLLIVIKGEFNMTGFAYLMRCIKNLDIKSMSETAGYIAKKEKKVKPVILIDMIRCGLKFKSGYNDYREFEFYSINDAKKATFLTRGLNNNIIRDYNDKSKMNVFDDKILFNELFKDFIGREWIDLRKATASDLEAMLKKYGAVIVKPADGICGKGIEKLTYTEAMDVEAEYKRFVENNQMLVENYLVQHSEMSRIYPNSVNTMRMFTFCKDGESHLLQTIIKFGNNGVVDNFHSGGMYAFADENGVVVTPALDKEDFVYEKHPATGESILGFKIPMHKEAKELVERAALLVPSMGYVGWDVAISENGPVVIEGNAYPGIFQPRPSFTESKEGVLPLYRKYMNI